jgi:hypothetical protein
MVPHIRGMNPNWPDDPTLSDLNAVCGDQVVLKKKSFGDTRVKNFIVSYERLATMANVIAIVIQLDILKKPLMISSLKPLLFCFGPIQINILHLVS